MVFVESSSKVGGGGGKGLRYDSITQYNHRVKSGEERDTFYRTVGKEGIRKATKYRSINARTTISIDRDVSAARYGEIIYQNSTPPAIYERRGQTRHPNRKNRIKILKNNKRN